jgi:hypothetical protein
VAEAIARLELPDLQVLTAIGEPGALLDAWATADSVIVVDAAMVDSADGRPIPFLIHLRRARRHSVWLKPMGWPALSVAYCGHWWCCRSI